METKVPEQVAEWMKDEVFVKKLENAVTDEDVVTAFKEKGIEISAEEIQEAIQQMDIGEGRELDEEDLEAVQGGSVLLGLAIFGIGAAATAIYIYLAKRKLQKDGILPAGKKTKKSR